MKINGKIEAVSNVRKSKLQGTEANIGIKIGDTWHNLDGNWDDLEDMKEEAVAAKMAGRPVSFESEKKGNTNVIQGIPDFKGGNGGDGKAPEKALGVAEELVDVVTIKEERAKRAKLCQETLEDAIAGYTNATGDERVWSELEGEVRAGLMAWATSMRIDAEKKRR